jgi:hypothetical protein
MKIIGFVGGFLVLVVAAVLVIGALLPARHVASRSASYRASAETLYGLIAGAQNWRPEVAQSETVKDSAGRELYRETSRRGETMLYEVTERVPPRLLKRKIANTGLPYSGSWTYEIQARDGGAVVRITEDGEVTNPVFRFVSRFVIGQTRTMDQYLRNLGKAVQQDSVDITN